MYIDKRAQHTRTLLNESLIKLLNEKPVGRITVKEICDEAGINRATYYRHYSDPKDQATMIYNNILADARDCVISHSKEINVREGLKSLCECFLNNRDAYVAVKDAVDAKERDEIITELFRWRLIPFLGYKNGQFDADSEDYIFDYATSAAQSTIHRWLVNDTEKFTPAYIADFLQNTVFSALFKTGHVA